MMTEKTYNKPIPSTIVLLSMDCPCTAHRSAKTDCLNCNRRAMNAHMETCQRLGLSHKPCAKSSGCLYIQLAHDRLFAANKAITLLPRMLWICMMHEAICRLMTGWQCRPWMPE